MHMISSDADLLHDLNEPLPTSAVPEDIHSIFCDTMREDMGKLDDALNELDTAAVKALAHRMKGAFEVLSIPVGASACRKLEQLSATSDAEQLRIVSAALRNFLREFIHE